MYSRDTRCLRQSGRYLVVHRLSLFSVTVITYFNFAFEFNQIVPLICSISASPNTVVALSVTRDQSEFQIVMELSLTCPNRLSRVTCDIAEPIQGLSGDYSGGGRGLMVIRILQWRHNGRNGVSNHKFHDCLLNVQIKGKIKALRHWPLWGEFTGHRWIPRTKGQQRGKCFHLMTSSWHDEW